MTNTHYLPKDFNATKVYDAILAMRPKSQLRRLIIRYGLTCCWCGRICNPTLAPNADAYPTREHLIRKADGGSSRMHNLKVACRKCNNSRHHPHPKTSS